MHIEVWPSKGKDGSLQWWWQFRAGNGRVVADPDAFPSKEHAIRAAKASVRSVLRPLDTKVAIFQIWQSDTLTKIRWF